MKYEDLMQYALKEDLAFKQLLDEMLYLTSQRLRPNDWTIEQIYDKLRPFYMATRSTLERMITPLLMGLQMNSANPFDFIRRLEMLRTAINIGDRNHIVAQNGFDGWIFTPVAGVVKFNQFLGRDIDVFLTRMYSFETSHVFASSSVFMDWVRYIDESLY